MTSPVSTTNEAVESRLFPQEDVETFSQSDSDESGGGKRNCSFDGFESCDNEKTRSCVRGRRGGDVELTLDLKPKKSNQLFSRKFRNSLRKEKMFFKTVWTTFFTPALRCSKI